MKQQAMLPDRDAERADADWFEHVIVELLPRLCATARRMCDNQADADDIVAECVERAWRRLSTLRDRSTFEGWIFRILTNVFLEERRTRLARPESESLDDIETLDFSLFEKLHQPFLLWWGNTEQQFLNRLLREDLERAVDALPESHRVVVILADMQGYAYKEIAEALGIPVGTVRSRLARGRAMLQKALWHHAADAGLVRDNTNPDAT